MEIFVRLDGRATFAQIAASSGLTWIEDVGIAVDGRVDNLGDLCAALGISESVGLHAALVRGFRVWHVDLPRRLAGEFTFVILDRRRRQLVAARDPFGVRPLFYKATDQTISVSNRIARLVGPDEPVDDHRLIEYLVKRYDPPGRTFFSNVREVLPGATFLAGEETLTESKYWEPETNSKPPIRDRLEFERGFRQLFLQAVARRLDRDRPAIIHVSGGLDSSAIACAADIARRSSSTTFELIGAAAVYPGMSCDESRYIDSVADHVGYPIIRWDDTSPELDDIFDPDPHGPGLRNLFRGGTAGDLRLARESNARVLLSGIGGDNLGIVEGYIADLIGTRRWRQGLAELISFPGATIRTRMERTRAVLRQFLPDRLDTCLRRLRTTVPAWLTPYAREIAKSLDLTRPRLPGKLSHIQTSLWLRVTLNEIARAISTMNIAAATYGCEYRFPFLDKDLVYYAMAAPLECWPKPRPFARLHRGPLTKILPPAIATRFGKAEFTPAIARKVRAVGPELLDAFGKEWVSERYVNPDAARRHCRAVIESPRTTADYACSEAWSILTLEAWLRRREGLVSTRPQRRKLTYHERIQE